MVERLRWHQGEGHAVVIVSASLGVYLRPLAERLGIDAALAVELVSDADGLLTGEVVGQLNTRGPEKLARLRSWTDQRLGPAQPYELWAYGDSAGDDVLLAGADHPTWVGRRAASADHPTSGRSRKSRG
jgi:HAD superfamily phosphoserine phosphatase-like hydrolase